MENDQTQPTQPITPTLSPIVTPTTEPIPLKPSRLPIILLSLLSLTFLSGLIYFYLQTQSLKQIKSINTTPSPSTTLAPSTTPIAQDTTTWVTKTYILKSDTAVRGSYSTNLEFKIPSDWTVETIPKDVENGIITNCADYLIESPQSEITITLSPICPGWAAQNSPWPKDAKVVMQRQQSGNTGEYTKYRLRFSNINTEYSYVDAQANDLVEDAIIITYTPPNESKDDFYFIPASFTTTSLKSISDKENYLKIIDQIAASIALK